MEREIIYYEENENASFTHDMYVCPDGSERVQP